MIILLLFTSGNTKLHSGLVFIPNMLTHEEQKSLADVNNLNLVRSKNRVTNCLKTR